MLGFHICYSLLKIWYMCYGSLILLMMRLRLREIQFLVQGPQARTEKGWVRAQSVWGKLRPCCSWAHRLLLVVEFPDTVGAHSPFYIPAWGRICVLLTTVTGDFSHGESLSHSAFSSFLKPGTEDKRESALASGLPQTSTHQTSNE